MSLLSKTPAPTATVSVLTTHVHYQVRAISPRYWVDEHGFEHHMGSTSGSLDMGLAEARTQLVRMAAFDVVEGREDWTYEILKVTKVTETTTEVVA